MVGSQNALHPNKTWLSFDVMLCQNLITNELKTKGGVCNDLKAQWYHI